MDALALSGGNEVHTTRNRHVATLVMLASLAASCVDPVTNDAVDRLGPEARGVREGPTHRPGQPCLTCHGDNGPGSPKMVVGGTIFKEPPKVPEGQPKPPITEGLAGVTVKLTDANGMTTDRNTNAVGNFYVFVDEWQPVWPLRVEVIVPDPTGSEKPLKYFSEMQSLLNGRVGCATCHSDSDTERTSTRSLRRVMVPPAALESP